MFHIRIVLCTALITVPIAALTRAPYTPPGAEAAILRFSWRMSVVAREDCRPRTTQELDALPVHMRTAELCTRDRARYVLITRVDATAPDTLELLRGGVKGDRPLFVLEERTLAPGRHRVAIDLYRLTDNAGELLASLDTVLALEPGEVQLVTLDSEGRRLTVRSSVSHLLPAEPQRSRRPAR
ncbi:hypothetical protein BH23GEM9_BH23GEM9_36210 [soil metagenome]